MIERKKCTIVWYVDDNKISHVDPKVIDRIILKIEEKFGKMYQIRRSEHEFLGMNIKFKNKNVTIKMKKHIQKAISDFDEDITSKVAITATNHLFNARESIPLCEKLTDNLHSVTLSLLLI